MFRAKIGLMVGILIKDYYNDFSATRPSAERLSKNLVKVLSNYGEVVYPGLVEDEESALSALKRFKREEVDLVVYTALSYTKGIVSTRALLDIDVPILLWNTQHLRSINKSVTFEQTWTNSGLAGLPETCNALLRANKPFVLVTSHPEDPKGMAVIKEYVSAGLVAKFLSGARIATVGNVYEGMTDFMIDEFDLRKTLGPTCFPIDPAYVIEVFNKISPKEVLSLISRDRNRYTAGKVRRDTFERSARLALSMEKMVGEFKADALSMLDQVWLSDRRIGIVPTYGYLHLNSLGIPCVCERDVATAVVLLMMERLTGPAALSEFLDMDFEKEAVILCHDSNGNPALAENPKSVVLGETPLYTGECGSGLSADFRYKTGPVTIVSLATVNHKWRLVMAEGESIPVLKRKLGAPFMLFKHTDKNLADFCRKWCTSGATHHMAITCGAVAKKLGRLAEIIKLETLTV